MAELTKSQIDKLGDRLTKGSRSEQDLRMLDEFRLSFDPFYQMVIEKIRSLGHFPSGRPEKTTESIVAKLQRQSIRLSRIQDIAGCRIIVPSIVRQDCLVNELQREFPAFKTYDRRTAPSHEYRAVHVVVKMGDRSIEIQARTTLQHVWAAISEKLADTFDSSIKYGGGPAHLRSLLTQISRQLAAIENLDPGKEHSDSANIERTILDIYSAFMGLPR